MHTEPAKLLDFTYDPPGSWLQAYRRIKYEVFNRELGWPVGGTSESPVAAASEFDGTASYSFLCLDNSAPFGSVLGTAIADAFPHEDLFARHCQHKAVAGALPSLCTLNALAVLPGYRRKRYSALERGWAGSAGQLLVFSQLEQQRAKGICGAILTAGSPEAVRFFWKVGFRVIDPPHQTTLHHTPLTNMALCFHNEGYRSAAVAIGIAPAPTVDINQNIQEFSTYLDSLFLSP